MKAVIATAFGAPEVLHVREVAKPIPKANELLIKIRATTVTAADWRMRSLDMPTGFKLLGRLMFGGSRPKPSMLGRELAGTVQAVGANITTFKVGDAVFAYTTSSMGGYAEYTCVPADGLVVHKPTTLTYEEAAALSFGGTTALDFFKRANLKTGETVLINGASGGVGTAAVQLAKHFRAHVTGVCSTPNVDMVKALGADDIIDYTQDDFTKRGATYDVIFDTVGTAPYARSKKALKRNGRLLFIVGGLPDLLRLPWVNLTSTQKVLTGAAAERIEDLRYLAQLAEQGVFKPIIDRRRTDRRSPPLRRYAAQERQRCHHGSRILITPSGSLPGLILLSNATPTGRLARRLSGARVPPQQRAGSATSRPSQPS